MQTRSIIIPILAAAALTWGAGAALAQAVGAAAASKPAAAATAAPAAKSGGQHGKGGVHGKGGGSGVAYATITLECGGKDYTVSTGNNSGKCTSSSNDGVKYVNCNSTGGNASASCAAGCTSSDGAGSCLKAKE